MNDQERYLLKLKIARLFYEENESQTKISERLEISRPTIIKLLNEAREEGIVKIEICDIRSQHTQGDLQDTIRKLLNIKNVIVVGVEDPQKLFSPLGKAAAEYFEQHIKSGMYVGLAWGRTLEEMSKNLTRMEHVESVVFSPLMGGPVSAENFSKLSNNICERMAEKFPAGKVHYLYAPLFTKDTNARDAYLAHESVKTVMGELEHLQIAVVGIGGDLENSMTYDMTDDHDAFMKKLKHQKIVGNICGRFYDIDGNALDGSLNQRTIAVSVEQLKAIPEVIAVGGGMHKVKSIVGASRLGIFDTLILDNHTANQIIKEFGAAE